MWTRDDGVYRYVTTVEDSCVITIEPWEHGYYVAVRDIAATEGGASITLKYFYSFQDARMFFTKLVNLMKS